MSRIKRLISLLLACMMVISLAACGSTGKNETTADSQNSQNSESADNTEKQSEPSGSQTEPVSSEAGTESTQDNTEPVTDETTAGSKVLVVYFSRTGEQYGVGVIEKGNTEIVAEMVAELAGADLYQVVPAEDYYPMTYNELTDVAKKEQNEKARPVYAATVPDLSGYDTIFVGAPVWWGDWPMIMYTFFENEDLSGKTLIPFCTHAGSGLSGFDKKLASACPDSTVLNGLAINGADTQNDPDSVRSKVSGWISGLEY
ncbi:MAG: flavodoxin [Oscillospiraceae bacterium]|nr:flavodoxin [Oscillospiraceae bacterium]